MSKYTKARPGPGISVIYTDNDGKHWSMFERSENIFWESDGPNQLVGYNLPDRKKFP